MYMVEGEREKERERESRFLEGIWAPKVYTILLRATFGRRSKASWWKPL